MASALGYPVESVAKQVLCPMLALAILVVAHCSAFAPQANAQQLDVSKHAQAQLTDSDAKRIFAEASKILQTKDGPNDVACDVTLSLFCNRWVNDPSRPKMPGGHDVIIGQNAAAGERHVRQCVIFGTDLKPVEISTDKQWVIPTGGGYFFLPSISALQNVLSV